MRIIFCLSFTIIRLYREMCMTKVYWLPILLLCSAGCSSPESVFQTAEKAPSMPTYQKFITDYPESGLAEKARQRIADIDAWGKILSSQTIPPYEMYLKDFPDGLYRSRAEARIQEINDFDAARQKDISEEYRSFQNKYPGSLFAQEAAKRLSELRTAERRYQIIKWETNEDAIRIYMEEFHNTGYAALLKPVLDAAMRSGAEAQGVEVNAKNKEEETRLHLADQSGLLKADKLFPDRGTDGSVKTDNSQRESKKPAKNRHARAHGDQRPAPKTRTGGGTVPPR